VNGADDLYRSLVSEWPADEEVVHGAPRLRVRLDDPGIVDGIIDPEHRMMLWDALTYLSDDILHKVDRAAMAISLETRVPLLDHRLAEFAWRLPLGMKIRHGKGKWILRQVLYRYVPQELIERPKAGFAVPIGQWIRGPLRQWAEDLLDEGHLAHQGYFNVRIVRNIWVDHVSGRRDWTARLWALLMFQSWLSKT
jgi:asparagine synthase (glutamine-hydrolysing)